MIYLDSGATSFPKPVQVTNAVSSALHNCANPGRGGYPAAMEAARRVYRCRERAAEMFDCQPEQVVFTSNCTHGLNIAIGSLASRGSRVVISGFEHNAVTRPLHKLEAKIRVAGRKLFDQADTLERFEDALKEGADFAVFTHVSNVFGYILPVKEMGELCRKYRHALRLRGEQLPRSHGKGPGDAAGPQRQGDRRRHHRHRPRRQDMRLQGTSELTAPLQ